MNFFDCIYICGYRAYKEYDPRWLNYAPKGKANSLLTLCFMSLGILLLLIINRFYKLHPRSLLENHLKITMGIAVIGIFFAQYLVSKYYSQERIDRLVEQFETKYLVERQIWGWIAGLTIVIPVILFALTLNEAI